MTLKPGERLFVGDPDVRRCDVQDCLSSVHFEAESHGGWNTVDGDLKMCVLHAGLYAPYFHMHKIKRPQIALEPLTELS